MFKYVMYFQYFMTYLLLGGGIAALSLAYFLKEDSIILEKDEKIGGLCRSYDFKGITHDVGPHILFSKNKEILALHSSFIKTNKIKRSNSIYFKGKFVKYPFENDLAALPEADRDYCLQEFLHNPYENYEAKNMLQFFLKTFGEGITRSYLQPYNEKIWKFDSSCMDTQMVGRIPKPPKEDVIKSAEGVETEGYKHQLHFEYPTTGGFQSLVDAYADRIKDKSKIMNPVNITSMKREGKEWVVESDKGQFKSEKMINCMPLHELFAYLDAPAEITTALDNMLYISIYVVLIRATKDTIGEKLAIYIADKDVIFHRLSKLNFLGDEYCAPDGKSTFLAEITYRPGSYLSTLPVEEIKEKVIDGLDNCNFVKREDVEDIEVNSFKYAYVIYDLDHRKNTDKVLEYLRSIGIESNGRFAEFEYMNSDHVAEHSQALAKKLEGGSNE